MSDQGLYRGKTEAGEWVKGWYCVWQGISLIFDSPFNLLHHPIEVIPASVGQSTGKRDGRKTEIFGGDILKSLFSKRTLTVLWSDADMAFLAKDKHSGHANMLTEWGLNNFEVIGNTTDNPELLEESEK